MRKLLKKQRFVPASIVTDRYRAYDAHFAILAFPTCTVVASG